MKLIIFDFDGTIVDTFVFAPAILNKVAAEFGYKKFTTDEIESLRSKPAKEIVREFNISRLKLIRMLFRARAELRSKIGEAKSFSGMKKLIDELREENKVAIASSNSAENIKKILERNGIEVDAIRTENSLFGKPRVIEGLIRKFGLEKENVVYVADEVRDVEAANKVGIKVISVSWGYNKKEILKQFNPIIADKPEDVARLLNEL